jgi:transposase
MNTEIIKERMQNLIKGGNVIKKLLLVIGLLMTLCRLSYAQTSFDAELSNLRKSILSMCAQLQSGQPKESQEQLLKEIDEIISGWERITATYKNTPPTEYAKDPEWKTYFDEALDNFQIMRQKVEGKDYKRAMQFCGLNCALFVKIHQINSISTLADKMFALRQNLKLALSMVKSGNWKGADKIVVNATKNMEEIEKSLVPERMDKQEYSSDIQLLRKSYRELREVFNKKDLQKLNEQFKAFWGTFNKIYSKYI